MRIRWFDSIAEASEIADHLPSAELLRPFGDRWAPFFVTGSLVQDQPDQPTLSMGNDSDSLIMSQSRDRAAIDNFEDASIGSSCGVSSTTEEKKTKTSWGGSTVDHEKLAEGQIHEMTAADINRFLVVCSLVPDLYCPGYTSAETLSKEANLMRTAARYKVDALKITTRVKRRAIG